MPNLADIEERCDFIMKLRYCQTQHHRMIDSDCKFIAHLQESYDSREQADDMGLTAWNPTAHDIERLGRLFDLLEATDET